VPKRTFSDEQVTAACGLHKDNLRRLITWGAVKPTQSGGGRGRIRLWTIDQAMRIAVTAEFHRSGFSLQMAHTLTYGLPLDDMLASYDRTFIDRHVDLGDPREVFMRALVMPELDEYWPGDEVIGSQTFIVDRALVYSDALGDAPTLFGAIDAERNQYHPIWWFTGRYFGPTAEDTGVVVRSAIRNVERSSLLVPDFYFRPKRERQKRPLLRIPEGIPGQIDRIEDVRYRTLTAINLAGALYVAFRRLHDLPVTDLSLEDYFIERRT